MLPKRLTWFGLGVVSGAAGAVYGYVRAREAATIEPARVADAMVGAGRRVGGGVLDVVAESRAAVREVEHELRRDHEIRRAGAGVAASPRVVEAVPATAVDALAPGVGHRGRRGRASVPRRSR